MADTVTLSLPKTQVEKTGNTEDNGNVLFVVTEKTDLIEKIKARLRLKEDDRNKIIQISEPKKLSTKIQAVVDHSKTKLNNLGILFLRKEGDLAEAIQYQLKAILQNPAKKVQKIFLGAMDKIQSSILQAFYIGCLKDTKSCFTSFDLNHFRDIATYIKSQTFQYGLQRETNDKQEPKIVQAQRTIFKPRELNGELSDFMPFIDKVLGLAS